MLCQKCGISPATVHRSPPGARATVEVHLCLLCAGEGRPEEPVATAVAPASPAGSGQRVRLDAAGQRVLRTLVARLLEPSSRGLSALTLSFGKRKGHTLHLSVVPPDKVRLVVPTVEFSAELRERADTFFGPTAERLGYQGLHVGWVSHLPAEVETIAAQLTRLFTAVFALPPDAELKVHFPEPAASPSAGSDV